MLSSKIRLRQAGHSVRMKMPINLIAVKKWKRSIFLTTCCLLTILAGHFFFFFVCCVCVMQVRIVVSNVKQVSTFLKIDKNSESLEGHEVIFSEANQKANLLPTRI